MNTVLEALKFRHACKKFDPEKKISAEQLKNIVHSAHLSPTSFGIEAWKFLVIESDAVKRKLRPACWNQPQITDSSHVIVVLTRPALVDPAGEYVRRSFERRGLPLDATLAYIEKYRRHMEAEVFPRMSAYAWCSKQCYIGLANIMTAAASEQIDSCPIEGFEKDRVEKVLEVDTEQYQVAVMVALGFRAGEQKTRYRHPIEDIVEYI